jgi:hypothetical protein
MSQNNSIELNLENFTSAGNLSTDISQNIYQKKTNPLFYKGLSFVLFYSRPCCKDYIEVFNKMKSQNFPFSVYLFETSKGTNSSIFSVLEHAPYRIMGFPYIVSYYDGNFCSVYRPNDLPTSETLSQDIVKYSNKIVNYNSCKM